MDEATRLERAIESFRFLRFTDFYGEEHRVSDLTNPDVAMGNCEEVSELFIRHLHEFGVTRDCIVEMVYTENATYWGYRATTHYGTPTTYGGTHYAVRVGDALVDWTACQFLGESALPVIKPAPNTEGRTK